jgi:predicted transposase YbfD/YdcC
LPYDHGVPGARWLNILMNRINPELFSDCFISWATDFRPSFSAKQIAVDGKTLRRSHDAQADVKALHLVSAFATHERLILGQEATAEKSNEIMAIPVLLERLASKGALGGALVSIDAMGCNPRVTQSVLDHNADYLIALKGNQMNLLQEVEAFFGHTCLLFDSCVEHDKGHGRIEQRSIRVTTDVARLKTEKLPHIAAVACIERRIERGSAVSFERQFYISSRVLSAKDFLDAVRLHWQIENAQHWVLDVTFKDDLARVRKGHGAKNMAVVRHFALNLVRNASDTKSLKLRRKVASWDTHYLSSLLINPNS